VLERHGVDPGRADEIADAIAAGEFGRAYGLVTPAMVDAFCAAGTPETVGDRLAALREHADGVVVGSPLGPDPADAIALAGAALDRSA
jgi:5,10-methylenetetrahydromethanopterin reductase